MPSIESPALGEGLSGGPTTTDRPATPRRVLAVAFGTLAAVIAYWAVVIAVAAASDSGSIDGTTGVAVGIGFLMMPVSFLLLARISRHLSLVRATAFAAAIALVIWTWVPFVIGELVSPFVAAVGCGGAVALRADPPQRIGHRLIAVLVVTVYSLIIVQVAFGLALLAAPFLPLPALLAADLVSERRAP